MAPFSVSSTNARYPRHRAQWMARPDQPAAQAMPAKVGLDPQPFISAAHTLSLSILGVIAAQPALSPLTPPAADLPLFPNIWPPARGVPPRSRQDTYLRPPREMWRDMSIIRQHGARRPCLPANARAQFRSRLSSAALSLHCTWDLPSIQSQP